MTFLWIVLGVLYVACWIYFGMSTFRKGHYWMFWIGFFFPFLWIIGYSGMDVGRDNGLVVDRAYADKAPYAFTGAVKKVVFDLKSAARHEDEKALHDAAAHGAAAHGISA